MKVGYPQNNPRVIGEAAATTPERQACVWTVFLSRRWCAIEDGNQATCAQVERRRAKTVQSVNERLAGDSRRRRAGVDGMTEWVCAADVGGYLKRRRRGEALKIRCGKSVGHNSTGDREQNERIRRPEGTLGAC